MLEIETKIIGIDVHKVRRSLKEHGARRIGRFLLRRYVFNLSKRKSEDNYVRVRTDGKESTLTYKFRKGSGLRNTTEIEVEVSDFEKTARIFSRFIKERYYQENMREAYSYRGNEIDINTWPGIPPYIEIEGRSSRGVLRCIKELGINGRQMGNVSVVKIYNLYGKDLHSMKSVRFR